MNILTLICLIILSLVSVLALVVSMLGGFFLGTILAFFCMGATAYGMHSMQKYLL